MISKNKQTKSHCLHYCSNLPIVLLVFLPSVHLAHHHQVMHPKVTVSSCSSPAQSPQFCSPACLRLTFYKPSFIFVFSPHTPPFYHPSRAWPRAGTSLMCARGSHCPPGSQSATKGQVAGCWDRKDGGCSVALIDLPQDDLRVLRERRPAEGSELVIMETPDFPGFLQENNWLPSGCPQTYPCQHLLRNRNEIHLIPPARPVPLLSIFPVTYDRNGSSSCLFCSLHLLSISRSPVQVLSSLTVPLPVLRLSEQPLRWLPAPTVPRPIHSPHCSQLLQYESDHFPSLLKNHQRHPPLLSEPSLDSLIHSRRPYRIWSLSPCSLISHHSLLWSTNSSHTELLPVFKDTRFQLLVFAHTVPSSLSFSPTLHACQLQDFLQILA